MKKENGIFFSSFFIAGTCFAFAMAIYGYLNGDENLIWNFIIYFILYGLIMGILARINYLKKNKETDSKERNGSD